MKYGLPPACDFQIFLTITINLAWPYKEISRMARKETQCFTMSFLIPKIITHYKLRKSGTHYQKWFDTGKSNSAIKNVWRIYGNKSLSQYTPVIMKLMVFSNIRMWGLFICVKHGIIKIINTNYYPLANSKHSLTLIPIHFLWDKIQK